MDNVIPTHCVLLLLCVVWDTHEIEVNNISLNKTAIQTDTVGSGTADLAVDGVISGGPCAQTSSVSASWEVDLGDYYIIDHVTLHPKSEQTDCPTGPTGGWSIWSCGTGVHSFGDEAASTIAIAPPAQWVQSVASFSSQYTTTSWSAARIVGPANVYPSYGNNPQAWAPYYVDANQFIELEFAESVYVSQVDIYETDHAGGVKTIKGYQAGQWVTLWSSTSIEDLLVARVFSPSLQVTTCFTNTIRLELDLTLANTWIEIDAVQIHGVIYNPSSAFNHIELFTGLSQDSYREEGSLPTGDIPSNFTVNVETFARWVKIRSDVDSVLAICEVEVMGYLPIKRQLFSKLTQYQCAGTPIATHFAVQSDIQCARLCQHQLAPRCHSAQYETALRQCILYEGFDTAPGSPGGVMLVHAYAVPLLD